MVKKLHKHKDGFPSGLFVQSSLERALDFEKSKSPAGGRFCLAKLSSTKNGYIKMDKKEKLNRIKSLKFHCENDDYFGTLATVLDLFRQEQNSKFKRLRDDLMWLQDNKKIIDK